MIVNLKVWKNGNFYFIDLKGENGSVEVFRHRDPKEVRYYLDRIKDILRCSVFLDGVDV
jgi:hypothetical protein